MRLVPVLFVASSTALPAVLHSRTALLNALLTHISLPIDFSFGVRVPTSSNPSSSNPLALLVNGYQIQIPLIAKSGTLVSWIANYADGKPYNTQFTSINPSAPRNITTDSDSTSQQGGNSFTNATALADGRQARVITTSFSSGNAASAAAAALVFHIFIRSLQQHSSCYHKCIGRSAHLDLCQYRQRLELAIDSECARRGSSIVMRRRLGPSCIRRS